MKDKIITFLFIGILVLFMSLFLVFKDREISFLERRKLTNYNSLKEDFTGNLDKYMNDQMPFRDSFIMLNNKFQRYILNNIESNKVYIENDYLIEKNYPENPKSITNFIKKINYIKKEYLKDNRVFYSIIPDKSAFLTKGLKIDFNSLNSYLFYNLDLEYINIFDLFTINDYFKSDIHLKQDSYFKVIKKMSAKLGFDYQELDYEKNYFKNFYGGSLAKAPVKIKEDLIYLTNRMIKEATVKHLEYGQKEVYDTAMLGKIDTYNVFLSGASSLIEINTKINNNKELIIFRDSFGSSLAPLLIPYYHKITLVDLRYISMDILPNYLDFKDTDILFLYSTLIVNNSEILKVKVNK